ncbi:MAG: GIY-YIG nuclease family protein [Smithella sp.]
MQHVYIYGLVCPKTNQIRYIGKSIRPKERLMNHMNEVSNCHRSHWLQSLKKKGLKPSLRILQAFSDPPSDGWQKYERYWIQYGKEHGWPLTNNTNGGDGVEGLPPETRAKMAKVWKGRKHKPESILKIAMTSKGRLKTESQKEVMRNKMKNREITWGYKISESARKLSLEQQEEIKSRLANGERTGVLALEYGVHRTTLTKVKMGTYGLKHKRK